jgi:ribonuclease HI
MTLYKRHAHLCDKSFSAEGLTPAEAEELERVRGLIEVGEAADFRPILQAMQQRTDEKVLLAAQMHALAESALWGGILGDLPPDTEGGGLPSATSFRSLPEHEDPPVWRGTMKPTAFEVRQLQIQNKSRGAHIRGASFIAGYSDASHHPPTKRAGWGIWLRDDDTRILRCGPSPKWVNSSNDAELTAVFAAIWTAVSNMDVERADILVIKTDSQHVARLYGWDGGMRRKPKKNQVLDLLYRSYQLVEEAGIHLVVRWVKGHRGKVDTQAYLNTQADRMAREAMKTQRGWKKIINLDER